MRKYFGSWDNYEGMRNSWFDSKYNYITEKDEQETPPADFPTDEQILFASYGGASYEGDATVIFERDGKLFENHGSHCSCYGLEDQWAPEATTAAALVMRQKKARDEYYYFLSDHEDAAYDAYWALVPQLVEREVGEPAS